METEEADLEPLLAVFIRQASGWEHLSGELGDHE
jgi:hypothetical protein